MRKTDEIITRFLAGEATPDDEIYLIDWIGKNNENRKYFASNERIWNALEILLKRKTYDPLAAFNKFKTETCTPVRKPLNLKILFHSSVKWAAIVVFLLSLGSLSVYFIFDQIDNLPEKTYEIEVPQGSRSNIMLTDGTSVWLNAESRLTYSSSFGNKNRTVHLEGEGYFDVATDSKHPFTVVTPQLEILALGTSFNVKSYLGEETIQTTLVSGSLIVRRTAFSATEKGIILEPNQQITYYHDSNILKFTPAGDDECQEKEVEPYETERATTDPLPRILLTKGIDPELFTSWKENRLIFDEENFVSIATKLERRYGAKIIFRDEKVKGQRFKGRFDKISIEQALDAMKFTSHFEYQIDNDTIFISSR